MIIFVDRVEIGWVPCGEISYIYRSSLFPKFLNAKVPFS